MILDSRMRRFMKTYEPGKIVCEQDEGHFQYRQARQAALCAVGAS